MSVLRTALTGAIRTAAVAHDAVRKPPPGAVLLAYHRIGGGSDSSVDLDASVFDDQLAHLGGGHEVVTLDAAVDRLALGEAGDDLQVAVTFDDGTADFVDVAVPLLVRHRVPATLYVATAFVGGRFPWGAPALSWAGLRDAVSTGLVTVGSHTDRHKVMDKVGVTEAREEARRSIAAIEDGVGVHPDHFAYPKGVAGAGAVPAELASHFHSLAGAEVGVNAWVGSDLHYLRRSPIVTTDGTDSFARKAAGGLYLEGRARAALNRVRYRNSAA